MTWLVVLAVVAATAVLCCVAASLGAEHGLGSDRQRHRVAMLEARRLIEAHRFSKRGDS